MSAEEADDRISEQGTRAIAERYGWDRTAAPANDHHANDSTPNKQREA